MVCFTFRISIILDRHTAIAFRYSDGRLRCVLCAVRLADAAAVLLRRHCGAFNGADIPLIEPKAFLRDSNPTISIAFVYPFAPYAHIIVILIRIDYTRRTSRATAGKMRRKKKTEKIKSESMKKLRKKIKNAFYKLTTIASRRSAMRSALQH